MTCWSCHGLIPPRRQRLLWSGLGGLILYSFPSVSPLVFFFALNAEHSSALEFTTVDTGSYKLSAYMSRVRSRLEGCRGIFACRRLRLQCPSDRVLPAVRTGGEGRDILAGRPRKFSGKAGDGRKKLSVKPGKYFRDGRGRAGNFSGTAGDAREIFAGRPGTDGTF